MSVVCHRLKNGIRVVIEPMPSMLSASIGIWVGRGSRHERIDQNGIAHFLEHMAFKGTSTRNARQIVESIENVGGHLNAYTDRDMTAFYARVLGADVHLAIEVLADILQDPIFDANEVETERGVILQEIGMYNDSPDAIIFDWLGEASYPDQALGRHILGTPETVSGFQANHFREFIGAHYGPENLVISAAGAIDPDAFLRQVEQLFDHIPYASDQSSEPARFVSGQLRVEKELEQAHIAMAFDAPSLNDDEFYAAQLLASILGGGASSRLFQTIREDRGLCYSIFASHHAISDSGQFIIYSGTSAEGMAPLMLETAKVLADFSQDLKPDEIERAKAGMRAGSVMALESVYAHVDRNARQLLAFDRLIPIESSLERIGSVTAQDIQNAAEKYLSRAPQMVLYGPIAEAPNQERFMSELSG